MAASQAPWICPLDAGDYLLPGRLERLRAETGYCDFVADDPLRRTEGHLDAAPHPVIGERLNLPCCLSFEDFVLSNIERPHPPGAELGGLKPLIRRSFLEDHGLAYDARLKVGAEFMLHALALALGARFKILPPCGYVAVAGEAPRAEAPGAAALRALIEASREIEDLQLSPEDLAALREHRAHLAAKLALREFLEARRQAGLIGAAAVLARAPSAAPYVMATVASDALRRRRPRPLQARAA
jgi:succinoglycan biosynthesis protein ExoU